MTAQLDESQLCGEQTDSLARPARCTLPADHYGERHHVEWPGLGSFTWGYLTEPDEEEPEAEPSIVDVPLALTAFVAGRPAPQGSKRGIATKYGKVAMIESSKNVKPWRESIRHALLDEHGRARATYPDGPVFVRLEFVMPRPASTPKRSTPPAVKRPDIDKLQRAVLDAVGSAGVWHDDSQVTRVEATKRIANLDEQPGCHIAISEA